MTDKNQEDIQDLRRKLHRCEEKKRYTRYNQTFDIRPPIQNTVGVGKRWFEKKGENARPPTRNLREKMSRSHYSNE